MNKSSMNRRDFTKTTLLSGAAIASGVVSAIAADPPVKRIRTGLIGCGSVSNQYLPQLTKCPFVEVVSLCDIKPERAKRQAERFNVAHHYPNVEAMLAGERFDFLVDTTDMQQHEEINRRASRQASMFGARSRSITRWPRGRSFYGSPRRKKPEALGCAHNGAESAVRIYGEATGGGKTRACRGGACGLRTRGSGLVCILL